MSHHHIEGLCTFLFKCWRENSKWSSCQQLVLQKQSGQTCKQLCPAAFIQVWTNLCYRECFCETNFHYEISRQKFEQKCAEPFCVVMTHHTAKANLEKGSSWPPGAIPHGSPPLRGLVLIQPISPTPWTRPQSSHSSDSPLRSDY